MQSPAPTLAQKPWARGDGPSALASSPERVHETQLLPAAPTGVADSSCPAEASSAQIPSPFGPTCSAECGELFLSFRYMGRCVRLYHE